MTNADFERIERIVEDATWRGAGIVAGIFGHYWACAICFLIPWVLEKIGVILLRRRITQLEAKLS